MIRLDGKSQRYPFQKQPLSTSILHFWGWKVIYAVFFHHLLNHRLWQGISLFPSQFLRQPVNADIGKSSTPLIILSYNWFISKVTSLLTHSLRNFLVVVMVSSPLSTPLDFSSRVPEAQVFCRSHSTLCNNLFLMKGNLWFYRSSIVQTN